MTELGGQRREEGVEKPELDAKAGEAGQEETTYLLRSAQPHPHFEPPEEQLHHLIVLEVHRWTVQLRSCTLVVPQQHGHHQPQEEQPKEGKTGVENQGGHGVGGTHGGPAGAPRQQGASTGAHQGQASGGHAAVAIGNRVKELERWKNISAADHREEKTETREEA